MTNEHDPYAPLKEHVADKASGEFIVASNDLEVHIYLQNGRIAWSTSSASRFAFARYLIEHCGVDGEALREIVQECRRTKKPLGETLIQWGVATPEQVRDALRSQIADAVQSLAGVRNASNLFLQRQGGYDSYSSELTFELDEILNVTLAVDDSNAPQAAPSPKVASGGTQSADTAVISQLTETLQDIIWAEMLRDGKVTASYSNMKDGKLATRKLSELTLGADADFAALRCMSGSIVGMAGETAETQVWCAMGPEATFGTAVSEMSEIVGLKSITGKNTHAASNAPNWSVDTGNDAVDRGWLDDVMSKSGELLSVAAIDEGSFTWRAYRDGIPFDEFRQTLTHALGVFSVAQENGLWTGDDPVDPRAMAFFGRALVLGDASVWHFVIETSTNPLRYLWMSVDRCMSQGFGWALISALQRQLKSGAGS